MRRVHADLLLLACAAIWGLAFLFQKSAMAHVGPLLFVAARGLVAATVLAPLAVVEHRRAERPIDPRLPGRSLIAAAAFLAGAVLQQTGIATASVTNTGFLTALYVVATPFAARALTGRAIAPEVWAAVVLSFAGTWMLGGGTLGGVGHGDLLVAASAAFWALHVVLVGMATPLGRPVLFTALQFLVLGVAALAGALALEPVGYAALRGAAGEILFVGVLSSALTFTLLTLALRATPPSEAVVIVSMDTVIAASAAWFILGERVNAIGAIGAGAIVTAGLIVQFAAIRRPEGRAGRR